MNDSLNFSISERKESTSLYPKSSCPPIGHGSIGKSASDSRLKKQIPKHHTQKDDEEETHKYSSSPATASSSKRVNSFSNNCNISNNNSNNIVTSYVYYFKSFQSRASGILYHFYCKLLIILVRSRVDYVGGGGDSCNEERSTRPDSSVSRWFNLDIEHAPEINDRVKGLLLGWRKKGSKSDEKRSYGSTPSNTAVTTTRVDFMLPNDPALHFKSEQSEEFKHYPNTGKKYILMESWYILEKSCASTTFAASSENAQRKEDLKEWYDDCCTFLRSVMTLTRLFPLFNRSNLEAQSKTSKLIRYEILSLDDKDDSHHDESVLDLNQSVLHETSNLFDQCAREFTLDELECPRYLARFSSYKVLIVYFIRVDSKLDSIESKLDSLLDKVNQSIEKSESPDSYIADVVAQIGGVFLAIILCSVAIANQQSPIISTAFALLGAICHRVFVIIVVKHRVTIYYCFSEFHNQILSPILDGALSSFSGQYTRLTRPDTGGDRTIIQIGSMA